MSEETSLRSVYESADAARKAVESEYDWRSEAYRTNLQTAISDFEKCRSLISQLNLFSVNESIDEVVTSELKYFAVDYLLAELLLRYNESPRKEVLEAAKRGFIRFLRLCDDYDMHNGPNKKLFEKVLDGTPGLFPQDPASRRETKIARFKEEKELKLKIGALEKDGNLADEDVTRDLYLAQLEFFIHKTFENLESINQELDLLNSMPEPQSHRDAVEDPREKRRREEAYSERLDHPTVFTANKAGPLLSKEGRPLRPFTLIDRREIAKNVFQPDHNLPTMSIDEYLEEERRRGNIIEGGGEKSGIIPEPDEDNMEKMDEETYKARAWDEYKEENPRGAGNTMNRG